MRRLLASYIAATMLSGCTPGLLLSLYNATGETVTVTNPRFRHVVTISPNTAADVAVRGDVVVQNAGHNWRYSSGSLAPPSSLFEQHGMVWRVFGRIDSRGYIYIRVPAGSAQPPGFPVKPQKI